MKKIYLQLTPFFPTEESFRGPYVFDQVNALLRNSAYEVIVVKLLSFYAKRQPESYEYQGVKVYNFRVLDLPSSVLPGVFDRINRYRLKRFLKKRVGIDMSQVSFIHSHVVYPAGELGVGLGMEYGVRTLVQHHGLDVFQEENGRILKGPLRRWNQNYMHQRFLEVVNHTDLNIGVSQKVLDKLYAVEGFSNPNTYVLYNGVDRSKFYRKDDVERSTVFTIGCIGNFWPLKDQMTLLEAVDMLVQEGKTLKVEFVGSGPTLNACKQYIAEHNLTAYVTFHNEIDHTQLNDFYNRLDLFVLPSYYEALGCVYTEALQVGVPVIGVKGQGIEELIEEKDRSQMLIYPHDHEKLAELIAWHMRHRRKVEYDLGIDRYIVPFLEHIERLK